MKINISTIDKVFHAKKSSVETMELKGYQLVKELFADSSGLGAENEPALTRGQFITELTALLKEYGELTAKITGAGQFQVYVGLFKKTARPSGKIIANNTLEILEKDKRIIRLYDTNILIFEKDKITVNTGGFNTRTTATRINEILPYGFVHRKNWEIYWNYNGKDHKLVDNQLSVKLSELKG